MSESARLARLDHAHLWHPFTPMRQWRQSPPLVIERGDGPYLFDTDGRRYIDGVSSLWCNVHGHRVPQIDQAIRDQLDRIAHSTLLGLSSPPAIELAAKLAAVAPREDPAGQRGATDGPLHKVFYSDAGATALEVAFKMAVGYWYHRGRPAKRKFLGLREAYHGDTVGAMSVGYSELFHKPFHAMVFDVRSFANPDVCRWPQARQHLQPGVWPSTDESLAEAMRDHCLADLARLLEQHADETAAIVIEPVMQGAAGMIAQPAGFVRGVADLARRHEVLLIADEVATGFGRTGAMFACEHDRVRPDILCLAKGISGGYLPLAATVTTDAVYDAFCGELHENKTLYHGHTYTGNALACAAALASLERFEQHRLIEHIRAAATILRERLEGLRDHPNVLDIRQRGVMVGIELCRDRSTAEPFDFSRRTAAELCLAMRPKGLIIRPLGDVMVLMPIPAMAHDVLHVMLDIVVETLGNWRAG